MFYKCDFILGDNNSIVIALPDHIPKGVPITLEVHRNTIVFMAGEEKVGDIPCGRRDILQRIVSKAKIGLIEFLSDAQRFPVYISAVATVEVALEAA